MRPVRASSPPASTSDVQEPDVLGVSLDEDLSWLHPVAHQVREQTLGRRRVLDRHALQRARLGVHRRLTQLLGVHLTEALEALEVHALLRQVERRLPQSPERQRLTLLGAESHLERRAPGLVYPL